MYMSPFPILERKMKIDYNNSFPIIIYILICPKQY